MNFGNEILIYFVWHMFMILNIIVLRCCVHTLTSSISFFFAIHGHFTTSKIELINFCKGEIEMFCSQYTRSEHKLLAFHKTWTQN
jgi:hypothetical protein